MKRWHSLLERQLKRYLADQSLLAPDLAPFLESVDAGYRESDVDRAMLERSIEISSQELNEANAALRAIKEELEERIQARTLDLTAANAELKHLAAYDLLTGVYNRRQFEVELGYRLEGLSEGGGEGAVLLIDLDQFKDVNDTLGHRAGDDLLSTVVDVIRSCLSEDDVIARQGGDEFAILLPDTTLARAHTIASRIEQAVRKNAFLLNQHPISVTASIGVAMYPHHGVTTADLLSNADLAMYQAKANGRAQVQLFQASRDWRAHSESRLRWRNLLVEALERDAFILYAQPIRSLCGDPLESFEILLRLPTPTGIARPGSFMDVAEEFGLASSIDRWVLGKSVRLMERREAKGNPVRLAVNFSGKSFGGSEMLTWIRSQIQSASIDPAHLVAEVTETAAIAHPERVQRSMRSLKGLGCKFALDDFGSGFSSFYHLKHLPVDYLKIDGSFIRDLATSEVDRHLVQAIVAVARSLGKQTVAEFVGNAPTVRLLRDFGVDYAQGYFIGKPRDAEKALLGEDRVLKAA